MRIDVFSSFSFGTSRSVLDAEYVAYLKRLVGIRDYLLGYVDLGTRTPALFRREPGLENCLGGLQGNLLVA